MGQRPTADRHVPVLRERIVEVLAPALDTTQESSGRPDRPGLPDRPVFVDGTLGMGGHTEAVLAACPHALAVGIDRDPQAIALASSRLARFEDRFVSVRATYDEIADVLAERGLPPARAVLLDLGVSSLQLDETERGFAYARDAPLDMRMDPSDETGTGTAADVLNTYPASDLARLLHEYGQERFARRIAAAIVREREREPFTTSARLVELLRRVIPAASQRTGGHPAKRTFQALRIEVNGELASLQAALPAALDSLAVGGRVAVLSYHSLEDRMVKGVFSAASRSSAPPGLPVELPEHAPYLRLLGRGAEVPAAAEIEANPRAASARLRVAERIRAGSGVGRQRDLPPARAASAARPTSTAHRRTRTDAGRKGHPR